MQYKHDGSANINDSSFLPCNTATYTPTTQNNKSGIELIDTFGRGPFLSQFSEKLIILLAFMVIYYLAYCVHTDRRVFLRFTNAMNHKTATS